MTIRSADHCLPARETAERPQQLLVSSVLTSTPDRRLTGIVPDQGAATMRSGRPVFRRSTL